MHVVGYTENEPEKIVLQKGERESSFFLLKPITISETERERRHPGFLVRPEK